MVSTREELVAAYDDLESKWFDLESRIDEAKDELGYLYEEREALIDEAYDEGMSYRAIGEAIRLSHTQVRKIVLRNDPLFRMTQLTKELARS